jgi:hypothetical protein
MHKSGSTSIQRTLDGHEDSNFVYAGLGSHANHSLAIYSTFAAQPERHHLHQSVGRDTNAIGEYNNAVKAALATTITRAGRRGVIISGEDIGLLPSSDLTSLADYFRARFESVEIVAYVRPPASLMASSFQELVKWGLRDFNPRRHYRSYRESFLKFDNAFGRENVHLWKFDPKNFPDGCVVRDFCHRLGLVVPPKKIVRLNESLSRQAVGLLYTYFRFAEADVRHMMPSPKAMQFGQLIGGHKFRFSPEITEPILQAARLDLEWIETRLGDSLRDNIDGVHDQGVREEADLLRHDDETIGKLLRALGRSPVDSARVRTPQEIARLVQEWHQTSAADGASTAGMRSGLGWLRNNNVLMRFFGLFPPYHR